MAKFQPRPLRRGPLPFSYVLLLSFVFFLLSTALGLWIVNKGMKPTLMRYAETQTRKIAPMVVNDAIKDVIPQAKDLSEVTQYVPNGSGGTSIQFRTDVINELTADLNKKIQLNLKQAERGNLEELERETGIKIDYDESSKGEGIAFSFPLGRATNNALLGNLGPRIPIRFTALGSVETDVETKIEHYPINNAFITVVVNVKVDVQIIIPFGTETATIIQEVPIAIGYHPGEVPQFYNGSGGIHPAIPVPETR